MRRDTGHQADEAHHHECQADMLSINEVEEVFHGREDKSRQKAMPNDENKKPARGGLMNDWALSIALK